MHTLIEFNQLNKEAAKEALFKCCGSTQWVENLMTHFPFQSEQVLFEQSRKYWYEQGTEKDYLEAFSHHPKIGDLKSLQKKFASTKAWAGNEQAGVNTATNETLQALANLNEVYFNKFGYIFIVCATGKSAEEMLQLLKERVAHSKSEELGIAKGEQFKITLIRLKKLLQLDAPYWKAVSQITTHVLDTSVGKPGKQLLIKLKKKNKEQWETLSLGITNEDGRIADLLPAGVHLPPGHYQMNFKTAAYFELLNVRGFYPEVTIDFTTFDETHYHVPLLINPFGYSTYRGS